MQAFHQKNGHATIITLGSDSNTLSCIGRHLQVRIRCRLIEGLIDLMYVLTELDVAQ